MKINHLFKKGRGGAEGGGMGGDVPPLAFKEGEEEKDVFGPEGPKNKKKMGFDEM